MIVAIAWRNIFRNRIRTLVTAFIIAVAVGGSIFYQGLIDGYDNMMMTNFLMGGPGHLEIFKDSFWIKKSPRLFFDPQKIRVRSPDIVATGERITGTGIINTGEKSRGIVYLGIEPDIEPEISFFKKWTKKGRWLSKDGEALIGRKLAEKLNLTLNDEIFIQAPMTNNDLGAISLRIVGIIYAPLEDVSSREVIMTIDDARRLTGIPSGMVTQKILIIKHPLDADELAASIKEKLPPQFTVYTWRQMVPLMDQWLKIMNEMNGLLYLIIFIGTFFAILNTLLMSVFERRKEFGVLLAIGMKPWKIIVMVLFESFFIGLIGLISGTVLGGALIYYFSIHGVDLGMFSKALETIGLERYIYPQFSATGIYYSTVSVLITIIITALYPAYRSYKLQPTEALKD